jgi:hypothetical protein
MKEDRLVLPEASKSSFHDVPRAGEARFRMAHDPTPLLAP